MFQINEYVNYGDKGVCTVDEIGTPPISGVEKDRKYYILHPVYAKGRTIYTPVDNEKVIMRKILTRQEAIELIDKIPKTDTIWVENEKFRENNYRMAMRSYDCQEWSKVIKTLYLRKEERESEGKTFTATDDKYLRMAEECLYGELSISLGLSKEKVEEYIAQRLKELEAQAVNGTDHEEIRI